MNAPLTDRLPDVVKTVAVDAPPEEAFRVFTEYPLDWWPEDHVFVPHRESLTIESGVGGRYYEVADDRTPVDWGRVILWEPPHRIALTWRVGAGWRPVFDDAVASVIDVEFAARPGGGTRITLTHTELHRHGDELSLAIHGALQGPSPGVTLERVAAAVASHVDGAS